jgi:hypothetical protein
VKKSVRRAGGLPDPKISSTLRLIVLPFYKVDWL